MICPECKKEIDHVISTAYVFQSAYFKEGTNKLDNDTWNHVGDGDIEKITCPECDEDITELVEM